MNVFKSDEESTEQKVRVLLGMMSHAQMCQFAELRLVNKIPDRVKWLTSLWEKAAAEADRTQSKRLRNAKPLPLTAEEERAAKQILESDVTLRADKRKLSFAAFDAGTLLAIQPYVSIERSNNIVSLGKDKPLFRRSLMPDPTSWKDGCVEFISPQGCSPYVSAMMVKRTSDSEIQISAVVRPRPNYMTVCKYGDSYVLVNGYHRAVAAMISGQSRIVCLIVVQNTRQLFSKVGCFDQRTVDERKPRVGSFCDNEACVVLSVKRSAERFRIGFQINLETKD